jgi:hypothetical protein
MRSCFYLYINENKIPSKWSKIEEIFGVNLCRVYAAYMQGIPRVWRYLTKTEKKDYLSRINFAILANLKRIYFRLKNWDCEMNLL